MWTRNLVLNSIICSILKLFFNNFFYPRMPCYDHGHEQSVFLVEKKQPFVLHLILHAGSKCPTFYSPYIKECWVCSMQTFDTKKDK